MREYARKHESPEDGAVSENLTDWGLVAISTAKDVFESLDTVPCIKVLAGVATTILETAQQVHTNKEDFRLLGRHAENVVVALARAQHDQGVEEDVELREDLRDVTTVMHDVLQFFEQEKTLNLGMRVLKKASTVSVIKDLDKRLDEAFRVFLMRSSVSLRQNQKAMAKQLEHISIAVSTPRPLTPEPDPLSIPISEGIYQIVSVETGCAIERGYNDTHDTHLMPTLECASRRQLWSFMRAGRTEKGWWIRNLYDGHGLDVLAWGQLPFVGGFQFHGEAWQTWEIEPKESRRGDPPIYTIRSCHNQKVLDSTCPSGNYCSRIHVAAARSSNNTCQEWNLILLRRRTRPPLESPFGLDEPRFVRNKETGAFLTQIDQFRRLNHPNVEAVSDDDVSIMSAWHFFYGSRVGESGENKVFHIVSAHHGSTLDHWNQEYLHASVGTKQNDHTWWEVIPSTKTPGAFVLKNRKSLKVMCHAGPEGTKTLQMIEASRYQENGCEWEIVEDPKAEACDVGILHDTHLWLIDPREILRPKRAGAGQASGDGGARWDTRLDNHQRSQLDEAVEREKQLIARVANRGLTSFVFALDEVDAGGKGAWERVRLMNADQTAGKSYNFPRC